MGLFDSISNALSGKTSNDALKRRMGDNVLDKTKPVVKAKKRSGGMSSKDISSFFDSLPDGKDNKIKSLAAGK